MYVVVRREPVWRNWQTQQTQNLPSRKGRVGSTPSTGNAVILRAAGPKDLSVAFDRNKIFRPFLKPQRDPSSSLAGLLRMTA